MSGLMVLRWLLAAALLAAFGLAAPAVASACACCDSSGDRRIVGWSDRGAALVEREVFGCESTHALEIWRLGGTRPTGCFDLYSEDPNARVSCGSLNDGWEMRDTTREDRLANFSRARFFPVSVEQLSPNFVRATVHPLPSPPDDFSFPARIEVEVRGNSGWTRVLTKRVHLGAHEYDEDGGYDGTQVQMPISVRVFPVPSSSQGLVHFSGHNEAPGLGHFDTDLVPVELPDFDDAQRVAPTHAVHALPTMNDPTVDHNAARAANGRGLRFHRADNFGRSTREFAAAVLQDPSNPMYRFNLGCAYARLGLTEAALSQLESLQNSGTDCSRCADVIRRARADDDLRSLRSSPRFQTAVGRP